MNLRLPARIAAAAGFTLAPLAGAAEPARLALDAAPQSATSADQRLADAIARRLSDSALRGYDVEVIAQNGMVDLVGTAGVAEHAEVVKIARGTPGVAGVRDRITTPGGIVPVTGTEGGVAGAPVPLAPGMIGGVGMGIDPTPLNGGFGAAHDLRPPNMPPYAWPTYAPYNNYSRVGYPETYPHSSFPFIGPFYPFPKVPLGYRAIKLEWEDGHWWYGRNKTRKDFWSARYW